MFQFLFGFHKNPLKGERGEERRLTSISKEQVMAQRS